MRGLMLATAPGGTVINHFQSNWDNSPDLTITDYKSKGGAYPMFRGTCSKSTPEKREEFDFGRTMRVEDGTVPPRPGLCSVGKKRNKSVIQRFQLEHRRHGSFWCSLRAPINSCAIYFLCSCFWREKKLTGGALHPPPRHATILLLLVCLVSVTSAFLARPTGARQAGGCMDVPLSSSMSVCWGGGVLASDAVWKHRSKYIENCNLSLFLAL